mmetsp:Transcript_11173/g.23298  ORF Transcript_11173/g.23298 Transcript_11173/m.23298 type:complete len:232 (+) Transcript_11173:562-1257(+)
MFPTRTIPNLGSHHQARVQTVVHCSRVVHNTTKHNRNHLLLHRDSISIRHRRNPNSRLQVKLVEVRVEALAQYLLRNNGNGSIGSGSNYSNRHSSGSGSSSRGATLWNSQLPTLSSRTGGHTQPNPLWSVGIFEVAILLPVPRALRRRNRGAATPALKAAAQDPHRPRRTIRRPTTLCLVQTASPRQPSPARHPRPPPEVRATGVPLHPLRESPAPLPRPPPPPRRRHGTC